MRRMASSWSTTLAKLGLRLKKTGQKEARHNLARRKVAFEQLESKLLLTTFVWDGGGSDNYWATAANWVGDVAPSAGDDLVFSGTSRTNPQNNFSTGTLFNSITFASSDFLLTGNRVTLSDKITVDSSVTGSILSLSVTVGNYFEVDVDNTSLEIKGIITGSNGLSKTGNGSLLVSGINTYSGTTTISQGTIQVNSTGRLGTGSITNNATLVFSQDTSAEFSNSISGTGTLVKQGAGTITLSGSNSYSGGTVIHEGTLRAGNVVGNGTIGTGAIINNGTLRFNRAGTTIISDVITGSGSLLQGIGTLVLAGDNTYSGETRIIGTGSIQIGNGGITGRLGTGAIIDEYGNRSLIFNRSDNWTVDNNFNGDINLHQRGTGTLTLAGALTGNVNVIQQGSGELILSGNNSHAGTTTINSGSVVKVSGDTALGFGNVVLSGVLDLNGFNPTLAALTGNGRVTSSVTGVSEISIGNTSSFSFSGIIEDGVGSVSLKKEGTGGMSLYGNNTYTGGTTITSGTLIVGTLLGYGRLGTGTIENNGSLIFYPGTSGATITDIISGTGSLTQVSGRLTLTGNNSYSGPTKLESSAALTIGIGGTIGSGDILGVNGTLIFNRNGNLSVSNDIWGSTNFNIRHQGSGNLTLSGDITGELNVHHEGAGLFTLTGDNSYTGTTVIDMSRTLKLVGNASIGSGAISVNGTLDINGYSPNLTNLAGQGTITSEIAGDATLTVRMDLGHSRTFYGIIQDGLGTVKLIKKGEGSLSLRGLNSYSGGTLIEEGTLTLDTWFPASLGSGEIVNNSTLSFEGRNSTTITNSISGTGQISINYGEFIFTGNNSYAGDTVLFRGATLRIGDGGISGSLGLGDIIGGDASYSGDLIFNRSDSLSVSSTISGAVWLRQQGLGTLTLSGNNSYTYGTRIDAGSTLRAGGSRALGNGDVLLHGTLDLNGYELIIGKLTGSGGVQSSNFGSVLSLGNDVTQPFTFSGTIQDGLGTVEVHKHGSGDFTLAGNHSYSGNTIVSAGTLKVGSANAIVSGAGKGNLIVDGVLDLNGFSVTLNGLIGHGTIYSSQTGSIVLTVGNDNVTSIFTGSIQNGTGIVGVTKTGIGELTLAGINTYTGSTIISAGSLEFDRYGLGNGAVVFDGGSLKWMSGNTQDVSERFTAIGSGKTLILDTNGNSVALAGVISGGGNLTKLGEGSLTLSGANSYLGLTTIAQGSIIADDIVVNGGSSNLGNSSSAVILGDVLHQGALIYKGTSATFTRGFLVNAGGGRILSDAESGTLLIATGGIASSGPLVFDGLGNLAVSSVISGPGALTKLGQGTLTLSGANTYSGMTSIVQGTISASSIQVISGTSNLGNAVSGVVLGDAIHRGTLSYTGVNATFTRGFTIGSSGGEVQVTAHSGALTISTGGISTAGNLVLGGNGNIVVSSAVSGAGSLTKVGGGSILLGGINSYDGDTTISEGLLKLGSATAVPTGTGKGNWIVEATLDLNGYAATLNGLTGYGTITSSQSSSVTLTVGGNNQGSIYHGTIEDGASTVNVVKIGTGTITLEGFNSHSGNTTIGDGILGFSSGGLGSGSILFDGGGLQWAIGNNEDVSDRFTAIASTKTAVLDTNGNDVLFANALWGAGGVVKIGSGTLILSAGNTYLGGTNISEGSLQFAWGALPSSGKIFIEPAGALNATGQYSTASAWLGSGRISTGSTGALALTANENSLISLGGYDGLFLGAASNVTISGGVIPAGGAYRLGGGTGTLTVSNALTDSVGSTSMSIRGEVLLTGANTFTGGTTLADGSLSIANANAIGGAGSHITFAGGVLRVTGTTFTSLSGHTVNWSTFDGGFDIASADNTFTINQSISGDGSLFKYGPGTLVLAGANFYQGDTTISDGRLALGSADSLPAGTGKGSVIVNSILDLNGFNAIVNGLAGSGLVTSSQGGTVVLAVGADDQSSTFTGTIEDGNGVISLSKIGSGAFSLTGNNTYTGDTSAHSGDLSLDGNLSSHVITYGGTVTGWFFRDPDLAYAVRKALGLSPYDILTPQDLASLYSLTLDSNVISDLKGLEHATNLYALTMIPEDISIEGSLADARFSTSLEWLSGLDNLEVLVLQGTGLTDAVLNTIGGLESLQTLDVRYNDLSIIPQKAADLPRLSSLMVYGNSSIADNPRTGLRNLAGSLVNIDLAADRPEQATTIEELSASLYHLPIKIYEYLVNSIEFVPYTGAMKGPLAVIQTGRGNAWDTASLLAALFVESGIVQETHDSRTQNYQFASGRVHVPIETAMAYFGGANPLAVEIIAESAGLNPEMVLDGNSEIIGFVFDHFWLEAKIVGEEWISLDPSWKFQQLSSNPRNILDDVTWDMNIQTSEFFAEVRSELPIEFYESQVRDYLATNEPWLSIADLVHAGPIFTQAITALPSSLPYAIWDGIQDWDPHSASPRPVESLVYIPDSMTHRIRVTLRNSVSLDEYFDSGILSIPEVSLSSLIIRPTLDSQAWIRPELLINGISLAQSKIALEPNDSLKISIAYYKPGDGNNPTAEETYGGTPIFETLYLSGNYYAIMMDVDQVSNHLLKEQRRLVNEAAIDYMDGGPLKMDDSIGGFLHLANLEYLNQSNVSSKAIYDITASKRNVSSVSFGLLTAAAKQGAFYRPDTESHYSLQAMTSDLAKQLHIPVLPEKYVFDLFGSRIWPLFVSIDGDNTHNTELEHLIAHTGSALEHTVFESLTNANAMSTIKSLQLARERDIDIVEIAPFTSHSAINGMLNVASSIGASIAGYSSAGYTVWIPQTYTDLDNWSGVGYFAASPEGGYSHTITGGLKGGMNAGDPRNPNAPADGEDGNQDKSPDPIIFANGTLTHDESDFLFPGLGVPLGFARHYQSSQTETLSYDSDRGMGEGWSFTYSDRLEASADPGDPAGTKIWFTEGGVRRRFVPDGIGGYVTPDSIFGTLVNNGSGFGFTWTDTSGTVVHFHDADGSGISRLKWTADRHGNGVEITYNGNWQIETVADLVIPSRWLEFTYTGDKITAIEDFTGRIWAYGYSNGRLTSVTAPSDQDTAETAVEYEYYSNTTLDGLLKKVISPNGSATEFSYYPNRWGFEVKFADGDVQTIWYNVHRAQTAYVDEKNFTTYYAYNSDGNTTEELFADRTTNTSTWADNLRTSLADAFGQVETYDYDANGNLISLTDRMGYVTTFTYTDYSNLESVTRHHGPGNGDDETTLYSYLTDGLGKNDKLQSFTDAAGNVTSFTYDGASGARGLPSSKTAPLGTVTTGDPSDYVTRYTYNDAGQVILIEARANATTPIIESFAFDNRGSLLSSTNANGHTTTHTYDLIGRLLTTTLPDPDGIGGNPAPSISFTYDLNGNLLTSTSTTSNRVMSYVYDHLDRVVRVNNPDGTYRTQQYDLLGNLVAKTNELGSLTQYFYDERNRPIAIIAPDKNVFATNYDGGGRIVSTTDPLGNTTIFIHDALDRLTSTIDAKGGQTVRVYDDSGNLYSVTDPLGRSTIYYYDLLHQLTAITEADPDDWGPQASPVTWFYYDQNGNLSAETDPLGRTTVYIYDELDRLIMLIEPDPDDSGPQSSPVTHYTYDAVGNLVAVFDPLGNVTTNEYDALNRLTSVIEADPDDWWGPQWHPVTTYSYDVDGNLASVIDPLGRKFEYNYDLRNRLIRIAQPAPYGELYSESPIIEYSYDAVGNRISSTDQFGLVTHYAYDVLSQLISVSTLDGGVTRSEYDAVGNLTKVTDPLNRDTFYAYDELHRLISVTNSNYDTTVYAYDAVGNQTALTDPNGNKTEFVYDGLNRLVQRIDPLLESTLYVYDAIGKLTEITDREGRIRTYLFDNLDRLITETWLDGMSTVNTISYAYDAVGNLLSAVDDFSAYEFAYDNLYRLIQSDNSGTPGVPNVVLDYMYDAVGNLISTNDNTGITVDSIYDDLNRLNRQTWHGGGIDEARIDFGYNARSERTAAYRYSDLTGTQLIGRSSYTPDALGRISAISHLNALDSALANYNYAYDLAHQITQWSHHGETIEFTHDSTGQLTEANYLTQADENYAYDANGNRIGGGMVVGDNNQILSDGTYDYEYDAEGNLTLKTDILTGDYVEYRYDHRNRMISATNYSSASVVLQTVEFTYDLFDRRIAKTVDTDGAGPNVPVTIYTAYNGQHAWADFDEAEDVVARYLFGDGVDEIIARWTPTSGTAWYLTDHLGTVHDLVDDTGDLLNTVTYDSFGNMVNQTNPSGGDRFTYTGREYDAETGLYYHRARYYDPQLGRFVSQDPIGFAGEDVNLYRYVANQPLQYVDPSGLAKGFFGGIRGVADSIQGGIATLGSFGDFLFGIGDGGVETLNSTWDAIRNIPHIKSNESMIALWNGEPISKVIHSHFEPQIATLDALWNYDRTAEIIWNDLSEKTGTAHGRGRLFTDITLTMAGVGAIRYTQLVQKGGTAASAANISKAQTLEQRAADLVLRNNGKNRVSINKTSGRVNVDLQGKSHAGVPTPHVVEYKDNIIPSGPRAGQVGDRSPIGPTRPATAEDLRIVDRFLKSKGK